MPAVGTVFFDLGDTLGTPVLSPPPVRLAGFDAFDFAGRTDAARPVVVVVSAGRWSGWRPGRRWRRRRW
jgi:hypothetical protein